MPDNDLIAYFYLLKDEVAQTYLSKKELGEKSIQEWTGEDIKNFQDDLVQELNERLSERWFYTHLKPLTNEKLPRIDMLNILSRYTGYANWDDFMNRQEIEVKNRPKKRRVRLILSLVVGLFAILGVGYMLEGQKKSEMQVKNRFCFCDADSNKPIEEGVEVILMQENESPKTQMTDSTGCVNLLSKSDFIRFIAKAPYYKVDTLERTLPNQGLMEQIKLKRDDYALMILYFATADVLDWEKRRNQLDEMISEDAVVFQINENNMGMEMYNKQDFINKLTTPLKSLGAIEIVETIYDQHDKIINLRFMQQ